jgi:starch synthase
MRFLEFYDQINLLKGGIVFADYVTTVSPTYAKQIQTPEYGCALEGVLKAKRRVLTGILNGIDYSVWDPKRDKLLYDNYSANSLSRKALNKCALQKEVGLKVDKNIFLLGMVSRLVEQKGLDILCDSLDYLLKKCQVVILGLGDQKYCNILKKKAKKFKHNLAFINTFNEKTAHNIYSAADVFLMPSRFEPCGLSQMVGYKYATVPIVHATGGLVDTVVDVKHDGGGFVFDEYASDDLVIAVERAKELFKNKPAWEKLLKKVAGFDFSWKQAAGKYLELYDMVIKAGNR